MLGAVGGCEARLRLEEATGRLKRIGEGTESTCLEQGHVAAF